MKGTVVIYCIDGNEWVMFGKNILVSVSLLEEREREKVLIYSS